MNSNFNSNSSTALIQSHDEGQRIERQQHKHHVQILLLIAVMVGLVSGTLYGFGRYSLALKEQLQISQIQVSKFGILLDSGNYIGHPVTGYVYDHYGPRVSCVGAAMVVFCGYGAIAMAIVMSSGDNDDDKGNLTSISSLLCHLGFFSVGFGSGLGYIAGLGSVTKEFLGKPSLGKAVAATAAGYGLSSTLVGITFHHTSSLHAFFLFWAVLVAVVNLIGAAVFTNKVDNEGEEELDVHSIQMSDNNEVVMDNENDENDSNNGNEDGYHITRQHLSNTETFGQSDILSTHSQQSSYRPWAFSTRLQSWTNWKRVDYWILFGSFASVTGCGLFVINNISTMVQSIGQPDSLAGHLLFLLSICNVLGRILMGTLADLPNIHKVSLLQGVALVMLVAFLISAVSPFEEGDKLQSICLTITIAFVAIAYGGSWVLIVGILADVYGREDFGKDYGLIAMGPALSGMLFNSVSALIYEKHAEANGNDDGVCYGNECYRGSYWMAAIAALVGSLILYQMPITPRSS